MKSIIQTEKECFICGKQMVELHHIFMGNKHRKLADQDGLAVWLCPSHHQWGKYSAHKDPELRLELQQIGQRKYLETHSMEEWMARYGKNYL